MLQGKQLKYLLLMIKSSFQEKIRILEIYVVCHCELDSFPMLKKLFDEIGSDSQEYDFLILYDDIWKI